MVDRISIEEAELHQLRTFASMALGLDLAPTLNKEGVLANIRKVMPNITDIPILSDLKAAPVPATGSPINRRLRAGTTDIYEVKINVHTSKEAGGSDPVPVSHNGIAMFIPRGEDVWVREEYVTECLGHAEGFAYSQYTEGMGGLESTPRIVKSYPFSYV